MSAAYRSPRAAAEAVPPARDPEAEPEPEGGQWPFGVSREPSMSIGAALSILTQEFPAVRISKIRFLEDQGIVSPHRTPSGYRTYSYADIERLRFALAAQRDSFLPLKVIRERLVELDRGGQGAPVPGARVVTEDGDLTAAAARSRMSDEQLARAAQTTVEHVRELLRAGVLTADAGGKHPPTAVSVVSHARTLAEHGVQPRHLRTLRMAADRQLDLVEQITAPARSHRGSPAGAGGQAQAETQSAELARAFAQLHAAMLEDGVWRLG